MKALRRALFWCHLAAGSAAGLVVLTLCASGILLAFQPQILRRVEREARTVPARPAGSRLGAGTLLRLAGEASPGGAPTAVTLSSDPSEPAAAAFGRERVLFLDPETGAVLGAGSEAWRAFFERAQELHRWLALPERNREIGKAITGAANVAFLGLALSGLYIWWPRLRGIRRVSSVALFQRGLSGKARDFNWHNVIGIWSALAIVTITVTALPMSYRWANDAVYRIAGGPPPAAGGGEGRPRAGREGRAAKPLSAAEAERLDRLAEVAERRSTGWRAITLRAPEGRSPVAFTIEEGRFANRFARSSLTLDPDTGAVVKWEPYEQASAGRRARSWMRFLHTGEALGPTGQIAAALASLGGIFLAVTGISLALRRLASWRARRAGAPRTSTPREAELSRAKGAVS